MPDRDWTRIKQVFAAAAELRAEKRQAYLLEACGDDAMLRQEVQSLLEASDNVGNVIGADTPFDTSALRAAARTSPFPPTTELPGSTIGRYKLLQPIGEGGFGTVWLAEQRHPVDRQVALKIIKLGMDTRQVIARFEAERQALAMMDHPNIARVLDAGTTTAGRPYFVMELVKGIPLNDYCDQNNLSIRARLELLVPVCQAVQHAHQKGIIHRDLKSSNVLVFLHDGKPVPKVIDFGIAKAITQRLTDKTLFTEYKQMMGTPSYMSPEQAEFSGLDVDTRSDIYSLGVLMYELLTGVTPFDLDKLQHATDLEIQRLIREVEPPRPSTRLSTLKTIDTIAAHRRTDPRRLRQIVRGDLDWIVMKCLEKDRTRRYDTAEALARDIQHFLTYQPVTAGPPSKLYRIRKMVRRNRPAVVGVTLFIVVLALSAIISTWQALRATHAERRADREAAKQTAVNQFLNEMLGSADPMSLSSADPVRGRDITVREVMDEAARKLDRNSLQNQPHIEAAVRSTMGQVYSNLGQYREAERQLQIALSLNRRLYGPDSAESAGSLDVLGLLQRSQGRLSDAESLLREALGIRRRILQGNDPKIAETLNNLALVLNDRGNFQEATALLQEAIKINQAAFGEESRAQARTLNNLALVFQTQGKLDEAEPYLRQVTVLNRRLLGDEHPEVAISMHNLAMHLRAQGKQSQAEPLLRDVVVMWRRQLGNEHPLTATGMKNLGLVLLELDRVNEAEPLLRDALAIQRQQLGNEHIDVATTLNSLGLSLKQQGKLPEAEAALREALSIRQKALPAGHWARANSSSVMGEVLAAQKRFEEAEPLLLSGYQGLRDQPAAPKVRQRESIERIINLYDAWNKPADAAKWRATLQTFDSPAASPANPPK